MKKLVFCFCLSLRIREALITVRKNFQKKLIVPDAMLPMEFPMPDKTGWAYSRILFPTSVQSITDRSKRNGPIRRVVWESFGRTDSHWCDRKQEIDQALHSPRWNTPQMIAPRKTTTIKMITMAVPSPRVFSIFDSKTAQWAAE